MTETVSALNSVEPMTLLVSVAVFILASILLYLIWTCTMRERTFEEVMEEQRRLQLQSENLFAKTEKKEKDKKKKYKKGKGEKSDKSQERSDDKPVEEHIEVQKAVQVALEAPIPEPEIVAPPKSKPHVRKEKKVREHVESIEDVSDMKSTQHEETKIRAEGGIKITKQETVTTKLSKQEVKHVRSIEIESKRTKSGESSATYSKKERESDLRAAEELQASEEERSMIEPKGKQRPVHEEMRVEEVSAVRAEPKKFEKFKKSKQDVHAAGDASITLKSTSSSHIATMLRTAPLKDSEIQSLIEVLLNRQGASAPSVEWTKKSQKGDPVAQMKKQLEEKSQAFDEEQTRSQQAQGMLKDLRKELADSKVRYAVLEKQSQETVAALNARMQSTHESHTAEINNMHMQLNSMKAQANNDGQEQLIHRLTEENQRLKEAAAKNHSNNQFEQQRKIISDELSKKVAQLAASENAQKQMELKMNRAEEQLRKLEATKRDSESILTRKMNELSEELRRAEARNATFSNEMEKTRQLEQELTNLKNHIKNLEGSKADASRMLEKKLRDSEKVREELQGRMNNSEAQHSNKDRELQQLKETNMALSAQLKSTRERTSGEGEEAPSSKPNGEHIPAENEKSSADVAEHEKIVSELRREMEHVKSELKVSLTEKENMKSQLDSQMKKNNSLREKNWKAMDALSKAEKLAESKQSELSQLSADVQMAKKQSHVETVQLVQGAASPETIERDRYEQQLAELRESLSLSKQAGAQYEIAIQQLEVQLETARSCMAQEMSGKDEQIADLFQNLDKSQKALAQLKYEQEQEKHQAASVISALESQLSAAVPAVSPEEMAVVMAEVERLKEELSVTDKTIVELKSLREKESTAVKEKSDEISELQSKLDSAQTSLEVIDQLKKELSLAQEANQELANLRHEHYTMKEQLSAAHESLNEISRVDQKSLAASPVTETFSVEVEQVQQLGQLPQSSAATELKVANNIDAQVEQSTEQMATVTQLQDQQDNLQKALDVAQKSLEQSVENSDSLQKKFTEVDQERCRIQEEMATLKASLSSKENDLGELESLKNELAASKLEINDLKTMAEKSDELKESISQLKQELDTAKLSLAEKGISLEELAAEKADSSLVIEQLHDELAAAKAAVTLHDELKEQYNTLKESVDEMSKLREELDEAKTSLGDKSRLEDELVALKHSLKEVPSKTEDLDTAQDVPDSSSVLREDGEIRQEKTADASISSKPSLDKIAELEKEIERLKQELATTHAHPQHQTATQSSSTTTKESCVEKTEILEVSRVKEESRAVGKPPIEGESIAEVTRLQSELSAGEELFAGQAKLQEELAAARESLTEQTKSYKELVAKNATEVEHLKKELAAAQVNTDFFATLQVEFDKVTVANEEIARLKNELDSQQERAADVDKLKEELKVAKQAEEQVFDLQRQLDTAKSNEVETSQLQEQLTQANRKVSELEQSKMEVSPLKEQVRDEQLERLKEELEAAKVNADLFRTFEADVNRLGEMEEENTRLKSELHTAELQSELVRKLEKELQVCHKQILDLKDESAGGGQSSGAKEDLEQLQKELAEAKQGQEDLAQLQAEMDAAAQSVHILNEQLASSKINYAEMETLRAELVEAKQLIEAGTIQVNGHDSGDVQEVMKMESAMEVSSLPPSHSRTDSLKVAELKQQIETLKECESQNKLYLDEISALKQKIADLAVATDSDTSKVHAELASKNELIGQYENELSSLKQELCRLQEGQINGAEDAEKLGEDDALRTLQEKYTQSLGEIEKLKAELSQIHDNETLEKAKLAEEINQLRLEVESSSQQVQIDKYCAEIEQLRQDLAHEKEQNASLTSSLEESDRSLPTHFEERNRLLTELERVQQELSAVCETDSAGVVESTSKEISELRATVEARDAEISRLKSQQEKAPVNESQSNKIQSLEAELSQKQTELTTLESKFTQIQAEMTTVTDNLSKSQSELTQKIADLAQKEANLSQKEAEFSEVHKNLADVQAQLQTLRESSDNANRENTSDHEVKRLTDELNLVKKENHELRLGCEKATIALTKSEKSVEEIANIQAELKAKVSENATLRESLDVKSKQLNELNRQVDKQKHLFLQLEENKKQLEQQQHQQIQQQHQQIQQMMETQIEQQQMVHVQQIEVQRKHVEEIVQTQAYMQLGHQPVQSDDQRNEQQHLKKLKEEIEQEKNRQVAEFERQQKQFEQQQMQLEAQEKHSEEQRKQLQEQQKQLQEQRKQLQEQQKRLEEQQRELLQREEALHQHVSHSADSTVSTTDETSSTHLSSETHHTHTSEVIIQTRVQEKSSLDVSRILADRDALQAELMILQTVLAQKERELQILHQEHEEQETTPVHEPASGSAEVMHLREELAAKNAEMAELSEQLDECRYKLDMLQWRPVRRSDSMSSMSSIGSWLEPETASLEEQLEIKISEIHKLRQIVKDYWNQNNEMKEKLEHLESRGMQAGNRMIAELRQQLRIKEGELADQKTMLEVAKARAEELREQNWKMKDAAGQAEKTASSHSKVESHTKELLQRIFPDVQIKQNLPYSEWASTFEAEAKKSLSSHEPNGDVYDDEEARRLQAQVQHYQDVLADTESILNKLQSSVESEEKKWLQRVHLAESESTKAREELDKLQLAKISVSTEYEEKLRCLEEQLAKLENERENLESKLSEGLPNGTNSTATQDLSDTVAS